MNCQNHPEVPATAYCRSCGKPVCEQCRRDAFGTVYCEEHLPAPPPRPAEPSSYTAPAGSGYTTLEFKISFIKGMTKDTGPVRTEGRTLNVGRRAATAEARITDARGRLLAHATTTCLVFEIPKP